jgi:5'(3')-deoxyribonucleotidase
MKEIFIDMDGVIADLVPEVLKFHGITDYSHWPKGEYDMTKVFGPGIFEIPAMLYETLQPSAQCFKLLELCGKGAYLCSSAIPGTEVSKRLWLKKYNIMNKVIFIRDKELLAGPERLLIDDCDENCTKWTKAGGVATVWKQHWNHGTQRMEGVRDAIK